ncbi:Uncharacterised protein [Erysipelothrix rhusiopathiae]|nr:Uncharacterised protein [Erysipelothrix rhusiopathiae]
MSGGVDSAFIFGYSITHKAVGTWTEILSKSLIIK